MKRQRVPARRRRAQAMTEYLLFVGLIGWICSPVVHKHGGKIAGAFRDAAEAVRSIGDQISGKTADGH